MRTLDCILFITIFLYQNISAQDKTIDSLKKVLLTEKDDTNKIYTLNALNEIYDRGKYADYRIAMQYAKDILSLSEKLNFAKGKGIGYAEMGIAFYMQQDFSSSMKYDFIALRINEKIQNKKSMAINYDDIGELFHEENNDSIAIGYLNMSLKLYKELKDSNSIAQVLNLIGRVYENEGDYTGALENNFAALKICEALGKKAADWSIPLCYHSIANNYNAQALNSSEKSKARKLFFNALKYYYITLKYWKALGWKDGIGVVYIQIGNAYVNVRKFTAAADCFKKGIQYSQESNQKQYLQYGYLSISTLDTIQHNYKQAFEHYQKYILYRDSVYNEQSTQKSLQAQMQYKFDKKQDSLRAVDDKRALLANAEIKNQKTIRNFSYAGSLAFVGFVGFNFYRYRRRRKLQSQQEMLNERLRISRELHDDIGSTLGSISIYSEVAKNRSAKNENAEEAIEKIGSASRELIDKMSDIVWSVNPNNESFEQLVNRIQVFAAVMLTPHEILYTIQKDEALKKINLTSEERKNIYLIYKEAIYNIIKYAACTQVEIKLLLQAHEFVMNIKDNGKGFNINQDEKANVSLNGNGIKNMQARAASIHAVLKISSTVNDGTSITVSMKI